MRDNAVPFDPNQIKVEQDSLTVRALQAVKEHRLTIGLSELPAEVCAPQAMEKSLSELTF